MQAFVISLVSCIRGACQFPTEVRSLLGSVLSLSDSLQDVPIVFKTSLYFSSNKLHERSLFAIFLRLFCRFSLHEALWFLSSWNGQFHYVSHNLDFLARRMRINHSPKTWISVPVGNVSFPSMKMFTLSLLSVILIRVQLLHLVRARCFTQLWE